MGGVIFGASNAGGDIAWSLWVTKFAPPGRIADYMSVHTFFTGVRGVAAPLMAFHLINRFSLADLGIFNAALIFLLTATASTLHADWKYSARRQDAIRGLD